MAIEKFIIEKSDLNALLKGEVLAIQPKGNIKGFCIEIAGNLTNGDVIKAMFKGRDLSIIQERLEHTHWWNAPYKAESEGGE